MMIRPWCQWISAYHCAGVYDGEEGKLRDFNDSAPSFVLNEIVRPALSNGKMPVILAEECHTAEAVIRLNELLKAGKLLDEASYCDAGGQKVVWPCVEP